ncbi:MAG TPA: universal stress protein [Rhodocyclaceae bacterium]|nr:universal stress protein [Rhodocyclaceae bacterium]
MENVLIPVDGSEVSLRAVRFMIEQIGRGQPAALFVLYVQPPIVSGEVRMFVSQEAIAAYYRAEGEKALSKAKGLLDTAGVSYEACVEIGHIAETIARLAEEKRCHSIVLGGRGHGSVVGMLLGSITTKVLHLAKVPVTIVK